MRSLSATAQEPTPPPHIQIAHQRAYKIDRCRDLHTRPTQPTDTNTMNDHIIILPVLSITRLYTPFIHLLSQRSIAPTTIHYTTATAMPRLILAALPTYQPTNPTLISPLAYATNDVPSPTSLLRDSNIGYVQEGYCVCRTNIPLYRYISHPT